MAARICASLLVGLLIAACAGGASAPSQSAGPGSAPSPSTAPRSPSSSPHPSPIASPTPDQSPSSSPTPSGAGSSSVTTGAQAAALVLASEPMFAGVIPQSPELIGACCWYEVAPSTTGSGFDVSVTLGWGDCMAGCIDRHTWTYHVTPEGVVSLVDEEGPPPPGDVVQPGQGPANVTIHLLAGPTCPVETVPPDPNCLPRPVGNAEVVIRDHLGTEVARGPSDAAGTVAVELPAGAYVVEALPVEGLMGTPEPVAFGVTGGGFADLFLGYDTGIR